MPPSWRLLAIVLFPLLAAPTAWAQDPCPNSPKDDHSSTYTLWTGTSGNYYTQVGRALALAAGHKGLKISCRTSNGSVENIDALETGKADFALIQSDAAHLAWFGEKPFDHKYSKIRLIAPLFAEKVQILTRPHLYINSPAQFHRPESIWMGPPKSGSELTAQIVLQTSGNTLEEVKKLERTSNPGHAITFKEAVDLLRNGDLDAVFQTEVAPTKRIEDILSNRDLEIRLLGFDLPSVELLVKNGMYVETSLQKIDYPQLDAGIYTVGVAALLVTREGVDGDDIATLAQILRDNRDDLETHLQRTLLGDYEANFDPNGESLLSGNVASQLIEPSTLTLLGSRVAQGLSDRVQLNARQYLWTWPIPREAAIRILILLAALILVCAIGFLHPRGRQLMSRNTRVILLVVGCVIAWMIGGAWLQVVEGGLNQHFNTLRASCFSLAENVAAKLPIFFFTPPVPTTREGATIITWFTGIGVLLFTGFIFPLLKKLWQNLPHLRHQTPPANPI